MKYYAASVKRVYQTESNNSIFNNPVLIHGTHESLEAFIESVYYSIMNQNAGIVDIEFLFITHEEIQSS